MKIANLILTSQNGGAEQVFIDYLRVFKNLGHEVFSIVKNYAPYFEQAEKLSLKIRKTSNSLGMSDFVAVKNIKNFLIEFDADVVFAHTGRSANIARKAISKIKNKQILLVAINHSMNVKRSLGADLILNVNREIFYKTIDAGQDETKSFIMPNAIDLSDSSPKKTAINLLRKKNITLGVIGRLDDKIKNFDDAIKVIARLKKSSKDKKFLLKIAGDGLEKERLKNLAKELGVEKEVEFLGWVQNKEDFYSKIDIFCLTSIRETFGLVVLEAMKYQKPIISTQADGPKEILRENIDALTVPLDDIEKGITKSVLKLTKEKGLAQKLVNNSSLRLKENYSFDALEKRLKDIVG